MVALFFAALGQLADGHEPYEVHAVSNQAIVFDYWEGTIYKYRLEDTKISRLKMTAPSGTLGAGLSPTGLIWTLSSSNSAGRLTRHDERGRQTSSWAISMNLITELRKTRQVWIVPTGVASCVLLTSTEKLNDMEVIPPKYFSIKDGQLVRQGVSKEPLRIDDHGIWFRDYTIGGEYAYRYQDLQSFAQDCAKGIPIVGKEVRRSGPDTLDYYPVVASMQKAVFAELNENYSMNERTLHFRLFSFNNPPALSFSSNFELKLSKQDGGSESAKGLVHVSGSTIIVHRSNGKYKVHDAEKSW